MRVSITKQQSDEFCVGIGPDGSFAKRGAAGIAWRRPLVDGLTRPAPENQMHPALSIVFFTASSGAGFALLLLLGLGAPLGLLPPSASFGFAALAVVLLLAGGGLTSSVFHLGLSGKKTQAYSGGTSTFSTEQFSFARARQMRERG